VEKTNEERERGGKGAPALSKTCLIVEELVQRDFRGGRGKGRLEAKSPDITAHHNDPRTGGRGDCAGAENSIARWKNPSKVWNRVKKT